MGREAQHLVRIETGTAGDDVARTRQHMDHVVEAGAMRQRRGIERGVGAVDRRHLGLTAALTVSALSWSLVNFGLLLWLPGQLIAEGRTVGASSALIAQSTLIAAPTILASTWLYSRWSTRKRFRFRSSSGIVQILIVKWLR